MRHIAFNGNRALTPSMLKKPYVKIIGAYTKTTLGRGAWHTRRTAADEVDAQMRGGDGHAAFAEHQQPLRLREHADTTQRHLWERQWCVMDAKRHYCGTAYTHWATWRL